jgi:hypothetical protein
VENYIHSTLNLHLKVVDNRLQIQGYPQVLFGFAPIRARVKAEAGRP